jgi:hypothetical protein
MSEALILLETNTDRVDWAELRSLILSVGWPDRTETQIQTQFNKSSHKVLAFADRRLVGCARTTDCGRRQRRFLFRTRLGETNVVLLLAS